MGSKRRGDVDIDGLMILVVISVIGYGIWAGGSAAWRHFSGGHPASVECFQGEKMVYSGIAKDGLSHPAFGDTWTLEDRETGGTVRISGNATCVARDRSPDEDVTARLDTTNVENGTVRVSPINGKQYRFADGRWWTTSK